MYNIFDCFILHSFNYKSVDFQPSTSITLKIVNKNSLVLLIDVLSGVYPGGDFRGSNHLQIDFLNF